jgi:cytoskeletal protein RodZ
MDKRTVVRELIIQELKKKKKKEGKKKKHNKKTRFRNLVQFSLLIKVLELLLRCPILILIFKWNL